MAKKRKASALGIAIGAGIGAALNLQANKPSKAFKHASKSLRAKKYATHTGTSAGRRGEPYMSADDVEAYLAGQAVTIIYR